ncbi:hypothetical protein [Myroides injenensis]|uniref:hypothetical protein n=1 Tax=Myroides injenensis TaxID=1183151 RepID=UPI0002887911|nr:hypothetical protein [Myroides injenensis]
MDKQQIEEIFNETFAGLALFYRDCHLDQEVISNYKIGQIIQEKGYTDASYLSGGPSENIRYVIASAHAKDISALVPQMEQYGYVMLKSNSYFKVLDIFKLENKTQILLLEIPEQTVDFFSNNSSNIEEQIIEKAREKFKSIITLEPHPALQTKEWIERTSAPLGMNENGEFTI